jgi:hypothetical protein
MMIQPMKTTTNTMKIMIKMKIMKFPGHVRCFGSYFRGTKRKL